jgi:hypothetical protein
MDETPFADVDTETVLSGNSDWVGPDLLTSLTRHPLDCIDTEYPHYSRSVEDPEEVERPREQHPLFYGCFDWHSAVHSHWSLVRQLRLFDDHPEEAEISSALASRFTAEHAERESEFFAENESFEKPYGWGWLLRLASELHLWEDPRAAEWRDVLEPLEEQIVELVTAEFLSQGRPFRVGTHQNSAFALQCILDYARVVGDDALESAVADTSREFFEADRDYPVEYEPLGWDFLSPGLTEADLMRRVLAADEFEAWLDGFLPDVTTAPYDSVLEPVEVEAESDDGIALHLVGLNLSRAWSMAGIASELDDHRYVEPLERGARRHAERGLEKAFTDDYAGAHWLTSFVLYLLTRHDGGIAPA